MWRCLALAVMVEADKLCAGEAEGRAGLSPMNSIIRRLGVQNFAEVYLVCVESSLLIIESLLCNISSSSPVRSLPFSIPNDVLEKGLAGHQRLEL